MEQKTDKETTTIQNISIVEHKTSKQFQICVTTKKSVESLWLSEEEFGYLTECVDAIKYNKNHSVKTEEIVGDSTQK